MKFTKKARTAMKRARLDRGFTQTKVAQRARVSSGHISMIETGRRTPSPHLIGKLERMLKVELS